MTIKKAYATIQKPARSLASSFADAEGESTVVIGPPLGAEPGRGSPDPHAAIDHEVDARHVGALGGGEVERRIGDVLCLTEASEQRSVAHLTTELLVLQFSSG